MKLQSCLLSPITFLRHLKSCHRKPFFFFPLFPQRACQSTFWILGGISMAVAETKVAVCSLLNLGGAGVVIMFLCHLQPSKDLGLRKKQDCNTLSMPEQELVPLTQFLALKWHHLRLEQPQVLKELRGERRWNCHSILHSCNHHSVLPRKLAALLLANVVDGLVYGAVDLETQVRS